ncbi:MAG: hypothetical protein M3P30_11180 [Chloroflexota bacterium]|nr:hypothetical protein [Chloroflexota bacterium]
MPSRSKHGAKYSIVGADVTYTALFPRMDQPPAPMGVGDASPAPAIAYVVL